MRTYFLLILLIFICSNDVFAFKSATIAQVGSHVLTTREVLIAGILDRYYLLGNLPGHEKDKSKQAKSSKARADWILKYPSDLFSKQLTQVVLELVVLQEAENFSVAQVTKDQIIQLKEKIFLAFKGWSEWDSLKVSPGELEHHILRHLRSQLFLKYKTESSGIQITDAEAQDYFDKNKARFGDLNFSQFKENISQYLAQKRLEDNLKDWFELLKRKYKVRYLDPQKIK